LKAIGLLSLPCALPLVETISGNQTPAKSQRIAERGLRGRRWGGGRTNIWVYDSNGKEVTTSFLADEIPPPPQPWDFVVLDSGQFLGTRVDESVKHFVNKPGNYEFVVEYASYLSEQYAREVMKMPDAPFWSRERGASLSNRIKVTVTE
jgi:hypothetical protein